MERPGLLEFGVYALVLAGAATWVYGLPPFTHEPGAPHRAEVRAAADAGEDSPADRAQATAEGGEAGSDAVAADAGQAAQDASAEPADQPSLDPQPNLLRVTATRLNMRSEPHANSDLVGSYPRGALVEPVTTSGNWVLVRTVEDESMGWMYAGFLDPAAEN